MFKPMRISPKFDTDHWKAIDFSNEKGWQKAIDIFEDRIRGRFLEIINKIENHGFSGFAILALDCLLIETLQQFREGVGETPRGMSKKYFSRFLTKTSFSGFFDQCLAEMFYNQIRCGILHQAEAKGSSRILIRDDIPITQLAEDKRGLYINRALFHNQLIKEFETYVSHLRNNNPPDQTLRQKFKRKMDHICRVSMHPYTKVYYFAYGSNMKTDRFCKRISSAKPKDQGKIYDKKLVCNKQSKDGSGKANLTDSRGDIVWGVLYEMDSSELNLLDKFERGYDRKTICVETVKSKFKHAEFFQSEKLTLKPVAFDWYKQLIVSGALEHKLPADYIDSLRKLPAK